MPDKRRSFQEVVAAQTPAERERLATAEAFRDVLVRNPFQQDVTVIEDRDGTGEWRVEYFDDDGACYVTVFSGPQAERRARDYLRPSSLDGCEPSERSSARRLLPRPTCSSRLAFVLPCLPTKAPGTNHERVHLFLREAGEARRRLRK